MPDSRPTVELLTLTDIAEGYGLAKSTVGVYNRQAAQRRRAGTSRPHDFPAPAQRVGTTPLFDPDRVLDWFRHRPGQGVGGGRPSTKQKTSDADMTESPTDC